MIVSRYVYVRYNSNVVEELEDSEAGTSSTAKLADIEFDAKSLRSVKSGHGHDEGNRSRRSSNVSHISATSTASRKRAYEYENGIVLTSKFACDCLDDY